MHVSMQALKVFDAAARLESFKLAAEELALTPTAVSHHINNLEKRLNCQLFIRKTRKIALTASGKHLATATQNGFSLINSALDDLQDAGNHLKVNTTSSFAALVLLPELSQFNRVYPHITLDISTSEAIENDPYAIAIRFGDMNRVEQNTILTAEHYNLFSAGPLLKTLPENQLVYSSKWKNHHLPSIPLAAWCELNGFNKAQFQVVEYDQELFAIQQAIYENAFVFCSNTLAKDYVSRGQLFALNTKEIASELCYYIPNKTKLGSVSADIFCDWLRNVVNSI